MEINSSVESNDETEEEIFVETFSIKTPENIVSKEKEYVEVNSTKHSTCDPKESESEETVSNEAKSSEPVPPKKKRSRKNRKQRKKKVQKENPSLRQTKSKLKGKVIDTYSLADNREQGPSKIKHEQKQSTPKEKKGLDQLPRITQAKLNVLILFKPKPLNALVAKEHDVQQTHTAAKAEMVAEVLEMDEEEFVDDSDVEVIVSEKAKEPVRESRLMTAKLLQALIEFLKDNVGNPPSVPNPETEDDSKDDAEKASNKKRRTETAPDNHSLAQAQIYSLLCPLIHKSLLLLKKQARKISILI
ncbi:uncharacterized protein LOC110928950 [Helianthus annuus]|uniref:uncharacterized protein LOC110928950 n=1 Tax=Helianthus annuus TaxID=4232 RepID=UPI000B8F5157|nr:uncharacterized protein LOC110928950 [Helianthus annuus]